MGDQVSGENDRAQPALHHRLAELLHAVGLFQLIERIELLDARPHQLVARRLEVAVGRSHRVVTKSAVGDDRIQHDVVCPARCGAERGGRAVGGRLLELSGGLCAGRGCA